MPPEVSDFITYYGYLAIFFLVFIQEMGIPNPVPNELVLMFSGYLAYKGILYLPFVIFVSVSADIIGTGILYTLFYFLGNCILKHKPRWFPISEKSINKYTSQISQGGKWTIYVCRVTPFVRGYTSIIAGLLQIKAGIFLPIALISAITWSAICVITGYFLGPYWSYAGEKLGNAKLIILLAGLIFLILIFYRYFKKRSDRKDVS
jgi:membrane protein DedA with SNARE-associated domain